MTQAFTQDEPNLVNIPSDISSGTSLSLPEILSLPSTIGQTPTTTFPLNFPTNFAPLFITTDATSILSPMTSDQTDPSSPINEELQ